MRVNFNRIWSHVPLSAKLRLFWERITLSRITTIYFIFSVLHFSVQLGLQTRAFVINAQAASFLGELVHVGNASQAGFTVYNGDLHMCESAPSSLDANSCSVLWMNPNNTNSNGSNMTDLSSHSVSNTSMSSMPMLVVSSSMPSSSYAASSSSDTISSSTVSNSATVTSSVTSVSSSVLSNVVSSSISAVSSSKATTASQTTIRSVGTNPTPTDVAELPNSSAPGLSTHTSTHTVTVTLQVTATQAADSAHSSDSDSDDAHSDVNAAQSNIRRRSVSASPDEVDGQTSVKVDGIHGLGDVTLDHTCLTVLNWPLSQLEFTKREDITFIMFQFWLLAMSLVALLNESIPHIIASLLTHVLATGWGGFQIYDTAQFHEDFTSLTTNGACNGINLLPTYWQERSDAEIPSLALNSAALLVSAILSWRLIKSFGWQTFKRVGASRTINRIYNIVLMLSISIQVSLFFIAVAASLWLDQLINGSIGEMTTQPVLFKTIDIIVLVLLVPWLTMGWIAVRREQKIAMLAFMILAFLYTGGWASMFAAPTFRWTFVQWRFFGVMASASVFLALVTFALGVVCRMNFGKGLPRYLNAQEPLADDDFLPKAIAGKGMDDVEKAAFPSNELPIPTYNSIAFGPQSSTVPPTPASFDPRQLGPRFYNSSEPFEPQPNAPPLYSTRPDASAMSSRTVVSDGSSLKRSESSVSDASSTQSKRWVIE